MLQNDEPQQRRACAACRYHRRRCPPDCPQAPYFPHPEKQQEFLNVHKLFGLNNFTQLAQKLHPNEGDKDTAIESMIYEANIRSIHKVGGCLYITLDIVDQILHLYAELERVLDLLAFHRSLHLVPNHFQHRQDVQEIYHLKALLPHFSFHQTRGDQPLILYDEPILIPQPPATNNFFAFQHSDRVEEEGSSSIIERDCFRTNSSGLFD